MKKEDLQKHNGQDGEKSYVSYKGKVYDVTDSRLWKNGKHVNKHMAGMDLTEAMEAAPHGMDVLERFEQIGSIDGFKPKKEAVGKKALIKKLYRLFHPHPMILHFPMGLIVFTAIMQAMFIYYGKQSFETTALYSLVAGVIFTVPTILSGIVSWWVNYELAVTKIFMFKLIFSIILLFMGIFELTIHFSSDNLYWNGWGVIYSLMVFANVPVLAVVGFNGGKLSWG